MGTKEHTMKTTIKDMTKWMAYCGIAGMTATEWVHQVLGYERKTETLHADVMSNLCIGGWMHSYHYAGNHGIENTQHAHERLTEEVLSLAEEIDKRLHDLTAVENELRKMVHEEKRMSVDSATTETADAVGIASTALFALACEWRRDAEMHRNSCRLQEQAGRRDKADRYYQCSLDLDACAKRLDDLVVKSFLS